jgi:hypothetical protein
MNEQEQKKAILAFLVNVGAIMVDSDDNIVAIYDTLQPLVYPGENTAYKLYATCGKFWDIDFSLDLNWFGGRIRLTQHYLTLQERGLKVPVIHGDSTLEAYLTICGFQSITA